MIVITGINEYNHADLNLHVYQNPITENSFITYYLPEKTRVKIELLDMLGKATTIGVETTQQPGLNKYFLTNSTIQPGVYYLRLTAGGIGSSIVKVAVIR